MTDRRSILSSLCAGALALLAPVAALAGKRRELRPEALRLGAIGPAPEVQRPPLLQCCTVCNEVTPAGTPCACACELRGVFTEARLRLAYERFRSDYGLPPVMEGYRREEAEFFARMDAALAGREARR